MYLTKERFLQLWPVFLVTLALTLIILALFTLFSYFASVLPCALSFGLGCFLGILSGYVIPEMEQKKLRMLTLLPAILLFFYFHSIQTWLTLIDPADLVEDIAFTFLGSCIIFPFVGFLLFSTIFASISLGVHLRQRRTKRILT